MSAHEALDPPKVVARITVELIAKAFTDLEALVASTGLSQADVVNRAIQHLAYVEAETAAGATFHICRDRVSFQVEPL